MPSLEAKATRERPGFARGLPGRFPEADGGKKGLPLSRTGSRVPCASGKADCEAKKINKSEIFRWLASGILGNFGRLSRLPFHQAMSSTTQPTHQIRVRNSELEMDSRGNPSDDVDGQLRMAQTQLEELQAQREELERLKQETEHLNHRKRGLISSQVEVTERLSSSITLVEREIHEMRQEIEDLDQCRVCFANHLKKIEKLNPESWTRDQIAEKLDRAMAIVEHADDEYAQAAEHFSRTRSAPIFSGARRASRSPGGEFRQQFMRGLAFNLPLILMALFGFVLYLLR